MPKGQTEVNWANVLVLAAGIVDSFDTPCTLRQLFYQLVSRGLIRNNQTVYRTLSNRSAEARRRGEFPDLADNTAQVHIYQTYPSAQDALRQTAQSYRRDRTEGQPVTLLLGVEKDGMVAQMLQWFGDLGVGIIAFGGYSSESYEREIAEHTDTYGRPVVLLYAGDFDATGVDIDRNFIAQMSRRGVEFDQVVRVALNQKQIAEYNLAELVNDKDDPRAAKFLRDYRTNVQVELDALSPDQLRGLFEAALRDHWDGDVYQGVLDREAGERQTLLDLDRAQTPAER